MNEEDMNKFAKALKNEFETHPRLEDCLTPTEMLGLWRYLRVHSRHELVALLTFGELMSTEEPIKGFSEAMNDWLNKWHEIGETEPEETPEVIH